MHIKLMRFFKFRLRLRHWTLESISKANRKEITQQIAINKEKMTDMLIQNAIQMVYALLDSFRGQSNAKVFWFSLIYRAKCD